MNNDIERTGVTYFVKPILTNHERYQKWKLALTIMDPEWETKESFHEDDFIHAHGHDIYVQFLLDVSPRAQEIFLKMFDEKEKGE